MQSFTHHKIRDIGAVITDTFQYIRIHYKTIGKALLFFVLPIFIVQFFLIKDITEEIFSAFGSGNIDYINSIFGARYFFGVILGIIGNAVLTLVSLQHIKLTRDNYEPTPDAILENIVPYTLKLIALYFIYFFVLFVSVFFLFFPMIFFAIKFCMSTAVLIMEDESVLGAMRRSWELTKSYWWATFGLVVIMYIIMIIASYSLIIPLSALSIFTLETGAAELNDPSLWSNFYFVINGIITAISSLFTSVFLIAISIQYFNLVERKEGGNMRLEIESLLD